MTVLAPDLRNDGVVHPVQLARAEPDQGWDAGDAVQDGGLREVRAGDVQLLQRPRLLPLHGSHVLRDQVGLLHLEAAEELAALDEDLEGGALHLGTVIDAQHRQLDAVGAERLDVGVIHKADAPHVDHPQVGGGLLQGPDVKHLVHLSLLLLALFVSPVQIQQLNPIDKIVDFLHEVVQENSFTQAKTEIPAQISMQEGILNDVIVLLDFCWEGI